MPPGFLAALAVDASPSASSVHHDGRALSRDKLACPPENIGRHGNRAILTMHVGDVRVAPALSKEELDAAHELVRERYDWRGYDLDAGSLAAAAAEAQSGDEITFVAAKHGGAVGTLTLRVDGPLGLRAERTNGDVVKSVRVAGRRGCELTRLAVADGANSRAVLAALFNLAYAEADTLHGVTDVFIEVNPRHVVFYSRILGFVAVTGEIFCERVQAPAVLLHVDMKALGKRLQVLARRALLPPVLARAA